MSRDVRVTPLAQTDLAEAHRWYEQAQPGLGEEFLAAVEHAIDLVAEHPRAFGAVHGDVRRVLLRRFPYAVFYVLDDEVVVILGVFHARRDPATWLERAEEDDEA